MQILKTLVGLMSRKKKAAPALMEGLDPRPRLELELPADIDLGMLA